MDKFQQHSKINVTRKSQRNIKKQHKINNIYWMCCSLDVELTSNINLKTLSATSFICMQWLQSISCYCHVKCVDAVYFMLCAKYIKCKKMLYNFYNRADTKSKFVRATLYSMRAIIARNVPLRCLDHISATDKKKDSRKLQYRGRQLGLINVK